MMRWLTVAVNQDVIQGSVAAGGLDCHPQEDANADVLRTVATKIMPVQSETKNSKWYSSFFIIIIIIIIIIIKKKQYKYF